MTSYISYIPDSTAFKNIEHSNKGRPKFFLSQKGSGSPPIKLVTPTEQTVERAKADLKRNKDLTIPTYRGINSISSSRKRSHSSKKGKRTSSHSSKKGQTSHSSKKRKVEKAERKSNSKNRKLKDRKDRKKRNTNTKKRKEKRSKHKV